MEANQVNALIKALQQQRDTAMNGLAQAQSELAVARDIIAKLQEQLVQAKAKQEEAQPA